MRTLLDLEACARVIADNLLSLHHLSGRFATYYSGTVTAEAVVSWLLQFPTPDLVASAIRVLSTVNFVDDTKLATLLLRAFEGIPESDRTSAQFCTIGRSFDSGPRVSYSFAKSLGLREEELASRWIELADLGNASSASPLVFIDDNLASGKQFRCFLSELDIAFTGAREHLAVGLPTNRLAELKKRKIYLIVAAELGNQRTATENFAKSAGFDLSILTGSTDSTNWLDFGNAIWTTEAEAALFREFAATTARQLFSNKQWDDETRESRLLGYGNAQKLTVFAHNVPKTLVTIFWKFGYAEGVPWVPLFPERDEWLKNRDHIQGDSAERRLLARLLIAGGFGKAAPACSAAFEIDGEPTGGIAVKLPNDARCEQVARALVDGLDPLQPRSISRPARVSSTEKTLGSLMGLASSSVERDNSAIHQYNEALRKYKLDVLALAKVACRLVALPLRIYNEGTATATEVILTIELPDGVIHHESVPQLPSPPKKPDLGNEWIGRISALDRVSTMPDFGSIATNNRIRLTKDRGRRLLKLFIGKILPSTFRDFTLEYLQLPLPSTLQLHYTLVYEEATHPRAGVFLVDVTDDGGPPKFVIEAWAQQR